VAEDDQRCGGGVSRFITQSVLPPNPPLQVDWVIQQRFANVEAASAWLRSERRDATAGRRAADAGGHDDVHLVRDSTTGVRPAPVSAVISSRVRPGQEAAFRAWEQRIAIAQAKSAGFPGLPVRAADPKCCRMTGWRSCASTTERNLQAWLDSPERKRSSAGSSTFLEEFHARVVRTGLEAVVPFGGRRHLAPPSGR